MNREAERKRLVEMLKQNCHCINEDCEKCSRNGICFTHREADHLLDNGIVVPPVKVGQILYVIEAGLIFEAKVKEYKYCSNSVNGIHWHIIFEGLFAMSEAHIGKTVFTSREDAVKALEGSGEK